MVSNTWYVLAKYLLLLMSQVTWDKAANLCVPGTALGMLSQRWWGAGSLPSGGNVPAGEAADVWAV